MLACARRGIPHSVVFGGFAANVRMIQSLEKSCIFILVDQELAKRIKHARPSLVIASSCGIEPHRVVEYKPLLDEAFKIAGSENTKTIIFQRPECK